MAAGWRAGQRIEIQWRAGEDCQSRLLLAPASPTEYQEVMGENAPDGAGARNALWFALTPDGDLYPHCLEPPAIRGAVGLNAAGQRVPNSVVGIGPAAAARRYGRDWAPSPLEFVEAWEFATGKSLGAPGPPSPDGQPSRTQGPSDSDIPPLPSSWAVVTTLPDAAPSTWTVLAGTGEVQAGAAPPGLRGRRGR